MTVPTTSQPVHPAHSRVLVDGPPGPDGTSVQVPCAISAAMPMLSPSVGCGWIVSEMSSVSSPASIALAGNAFAAPAGSSATDTIQDLRAQGYSVQVNGSRNGPISECAVNAVRGLSDDTTATVYVDLSCPHVYIDD